MAFTGTNMGLGNISKLSTAISRSISAENVYGEKGAGGRAEVSDTPQPAVLKIGQAWQNNKASRELGQKWKVRPCFQIPSGATATIMDVACSGVIQHIWITIEAKRSRDLIMRIYWDGEKTPSVEVPVGDFFCNGWNQRANVLSLPINVNPYGGFNSYFPMPFRKRARITIENRGVDETPFFFYTINFTETAVDADEAYFHAQFRRANPLQYMEDYTILDGVKGQGHYVGTYMAWQQNTGGWWGEGEVKMFIDGDKEFPTICGTGTEDYFGGAWCFGDNYSAPFLGYPYGNSSFKTGGQSGSRHGLYRFHIMDPVRFQKDFRVTIQALGWRSEWRFLPLQDDIASVAYWYQSEPHGAFPALGDRNALEVIPNVAPPIPTT